MSSVKLFQRKKVQGEKVKVAKNRDDRDHPPNQIWLKNSRKKIVPAQEKKILKIYKNIYSRMKSKQKVGKKYMKTF